MLSHTFYQPLRRDSTDTSIAGVAHYRFLSLGQPRTHVGSNHCLENDQLANLKINQAHFQNG
ncbi:hypothetical protein DPMN_117547 [Dreissena polymorpha]|uniref:Uncharacterized protein n=1 Tax=Dreissena polymorpha TaxID=45954 RepID=A0A9D4QUE6_DREPO|nr:hypothetical protein DPMN_117547 [Dreissena polymorpha]